MPNEIDGFFRPVSWHVMIWDGNAAPGGGRYAVREAESSFFGSKAMLNQRRRSRELWPLQKLEACKDGGKEALRRPMQWAVSS